MCSSSDFLTNLHLESLNNEFILYHVLVKRTGQGKTEFLNLAREILSAVLLTFLRSSVPRMDFQLTWNVSSLLSSHVTRLFEYPLTGYSFVTSAFPVLAY
jgi:hypothetical protein